MFCYVKTSLQTQSARIPLKREGQLTTVVQATAHAIFMVKVRFNEKEERYVICWQVTPFMASFMFRR